MINFRAAALGLAAALFAAGAASAQTHPTIVVTPGPNKPIEVFHDDQRACWNYADRVVAGDDSSPAGDVLAGTFVGAALGAILGGAADHRHGAGIGAAAGAVAGTAIGAGVAEQNQARRQDAYDDAYARCMYAHDNIVPGQVGDEPPPPPPSR